MDRYDKKFQKFILGELLKGKQCFTDFDEDMVALSDGKCIKILRIEDCFIKILKGVELFHLLYDSKNAIYLSDNYTYTKVKGIKGLCLKINDNYSVDSKYLSFFDLDVSDLYFDTKGVLYIKEDDLLSGAILCIKGGQADD